MSASIITNEMVAKAWETWCANGDRPNIFAMRATLSAVAKDIVKAEREACAKIAAELTVEEWTGDSGGRETISVEEHAERIAAAIRSRSTKENNSG